jgi:hypothetical protein
MRYGCDLDCIAEVEVRWVMDCFGVQIGKKLRSSSLEHFLERLQCGEEAGWR